ncbi:MAG TPA: thiamine pyrophosphate-binding protein [Blastocatellia bacterium]|nr:thiamine pyrophosphate-binding protein [Blastocatellia bacterium]
MNGGAILAQLLAQHGVRFLFTLSGGHIAPIFVEAKRAGLRVVDVRHEANAVFAADAVARLSGVPGVAAVTAGPGLTNTITAVKNAQLAGSPVIVLGGATATILKGRGALQDIDQMALMKPHVKWAATAERVKDLVPLLKEAFRVCQAGVPGPVFLECPLDLLYDEQLARQWMVSSDKPPQNLRERLLRWYLHRHLNKIFSGTENLVIRADTTIVRALWHSPSQLKRAAAMLRQAQRPIFIIGSQAVPQPEHANCVAQVVRTLGVPVYLSGMARGLLGQDHPLQMRHKRREALREADLVLLAGVPCDFRLDYGRQIRGATKLISVNRSRNDLYLNRKPTLAIEGDPARFLMALSEERCDGNARTEWINTLTSRDDDREREIDHQAGLETDGINPLQLFRTLEGTLNDNAVLVADGGDFVATASYTLRPRGPLAWLDPGPFGTLGIGGGFALGAKLVRPEAEVWILWGDGSSAYSLAEFDTFARHRIPVIGLIGNDACWSQIAREQINLLHDDTAALLAFSDYDRVASGFGGDGVRIDRIEALLPAIANARAVTAQGRPFLINAILGKSEFRKGSLAM